MTVDIVVRHSSSRFLLVKRSHANLSWKGVWATPGGRIFRNEKIRDAAHRVLLRETGIRVSPKEFTFQGVEEIITTKEHRVTVVFAARARQSELRLDKTSSSARWFTVADVPKSLRPEYRTILSTGGVSLRRKRWNP